MLTLRAVDFYDLSGGPNRGAGENYQLDVVTPNELLAILERRELEQRKRFEHVISEMTEMRDSLVRVKTETTVDAPEGAEPEDAQAGQPRDDGKTAEQKTVERAQALRLLRAQRALLQTQKSGGETLGVALSFLDIREELINNRVDTPEREERLKEQIADPLQLVCDNLFPDLEARVKKLIAILEPADAGLEAGVAEADSAVQLTSEILTELEQVLARMLELEDYNELLDIVRQLIKDQEELIETTKDARRSGLRDL